MEFQSTKKDQEQWSRLNFHLAVEILELLDPTDYAVTSAWHGVCIYPRRWGAKATQWELNLLSSGLKIPADWTGYLSRIQQTAVLTKGPN